MTKEQGDKHQLLYELETLVRRIESGDLTVEQVLKEPAVFLSFNVKVRRNKYPWGKDPEPAPAKTCRVP